MSSSAAVSTFNGPFKRAELILLPQYAASDMFATNGSWTGSRNHVLSVENTTEGVKTTEPLYCIVVGMISPDKVYLGKHGNFSTKFSENAQKAKLQFTVTRPNDPDFGPDFDKAVIAFEERQQVVSESARHRFFLLKEEGNAMRMNFALFELRVDGYDREREKETRAYNIDQQYETYWSSAKNTHYCCIMPVFDMNDSPVDPAQFAKTLVGALCEITFTLKHYAIGARKHADGSDIAANDVFSAHVESVAVLKKPEVIARSPYKGRLTRRPHHKPQLPSRGEQINAAQAFVPKPELDSPSSKISTLPGPDPPTITPTSGSINTDSDSTAAIASAGIIIPVDSPIIIPVDTPGIIIPVDTPGIIMPVDTPAIPASPAMKPILVNSIIIPAKAKPAIVESQGSSTSIATLSSDSAKDLDGSPSPLKKRKYV